MRFAMLARGFDQLNGNHNMTFIDDMQDLYVRETIWSCTLININSCLDLLSTLNKKGHEKQKSTKGI